MFALLLGIPFVWWMAILTVFFLTEVALLACDEYGWSAIFMTCAVFAALYVNHHAIASWAPTHLSYIFLIYVPAYLALGLGTAFFKWILYVAKRVRWIKETREKFSPDPKSPRSPEEQFVTYYERRVSSSRHRVNDVDWNKPEALVDALTPRAKDNRGKITVWIYQWPIVIVSSLIEDLLLKLAKQFARIVDALFSKYVRAMVAKAVNGL